ncbi:MMPL family transporter [Nocardioides campestrisoli]|uniref:MMPL family transporter n=1 Tax=Nocardioides campestrisoli TaxID=2736757 RepID=UPI0015E77A30|nr:MMPL family transporter [Nocardioides campestrisoli]
MATLLYRLGKTAFRRWPFFLIAWLIAFLAIGGFAATQSKPMSDALTIPGIPSEKASDLQQELFPNAEDPFAEATVNIVAVAPEGTTLEDPENVKAIEQLLAGIPELPQTPPVKEMQLVDPATAAAGQEKMVLDAAKESGMPLDVARENAKVLSPLSEDKTTGIVSFEWDVESPTEVKGTTIDELEELLADVEDSSGMRLEINGSGTSVITELGLTSEAIGVAVALVVLLITFGSLVAAGMPILIALVAVGLTNVGIIGMTAFTDIGSTTPLLATMIGLAVGIDYTLFILARYRSELHHTDDRQEAMGIAVGTAGSAVVFAGLTVIIALAALVVVDIPFLASMGFAAATGVALAVLAALTLLPAFLGVLKSKAFGGQVIKHNPKREADGHVINNGVRWARLIGKAPAAFALLVVIVLGALAFPIKDLYLAFPTDGTKPTSTTQRQATDLTADAFGAGREGPFIVVVDAGDVPEKERGQAFGEVAGWAAEMDGVANAQVVMSNEEGTGAQVLVTPTTGPDDEETTELLQALRDGQSDIEEQTGATTGVTGLTAITTDVSDRLNDALPVYLAVVIGLAFVLLVLVFRSILVPLTATLGFLLSVLATLGATVLVFQEGALGIIEGQPIVSFMPIILIGMVFGLAMDYQVFLVTRMREAHVHGKSTRDAVVDGFRNSARVVTAAAAIMIAVFAAFILQTEPIIKSMGFALAVAIVFDAFIVRLVLIPALLYMLGDKAWWIPRWLDKILPNVDVEGEKLHRPYLKDGVPEDDYI